MKVRQVAIGGAILNDGEARREAVAGGAKRQEERQRKALDTAGAYVNNVDGIEIRGGKVSMGTNEADIARRRLIRTGNQNSASYADQSNLCWAGEAS